MSIAKINNLFFFVMYPPQPSLKNREEVEMYKLKRLQFCLLKSNFYKTYGFSIHRF